MRSRPLPLHWAPIVLLALAGGTISCTWSSIAADAALGADAGGDVEPVALHWYSTCATAVCAATPDGGANDARSDDAANCPEVGAACTKLGERCGDPSTESCGVVLECDECDPKWMGCPALQASP
ncbi:MAG: hypothetical protein ACHREM_32755 [Polyangiales bacterium]